MLITVNERRGGTLHPRPVTMVGVRAAISFDEVQCGMPIHPYFLSPQLMRPAETYSRSQWLARLGRSSLFDSRNTTEVCYPLSSLNSTHKRMIGLQVIVGAITTGVAAGSKNVHSSLIQLPQN